MILNRKIFDNGIAKIAEAFNDFGMTLKRADIWYEYSKNLDDSMWEKKIANCIKGCRKIPTLADILDIKGHYSDNSKEYKYFEPGVDDYEGGPIPKHIMKKMDDLNKKLTMPER